MGVSEEFGQFACCADLDFGPSSGSIVVLVNKGGNPMWTKPRFVEIKMDAEAKSYMDDLD